MRRASVALLPCQLSFFAQSVISSTNISFSSHLCQPTTPTDDDSDADLVTDYLDAPTLTATSNTTSKPVTAKLSTPTPTPNIKNYFVSTVDIKDKGLMSSSELGYANGTSGSGSNNHFNAGSNSNTITITTPSGHTTNNNNIIISNNCNMVPIISVTPHSPGAKYNSILEDSLSHLQSIRETVVQMKNSSAQNTNFGHIGIINPTVITVIFGSRVIAQLSIFLSLLSPRLTSAAGIIKDFLLMSIITKSQRLKCDLAGRSKRHDVHVEWQSPKVVDSHRRSHRLHEKLAQEVSQPPWCC